MCMLLNNISDVTNSGNHLDCIMMNLHSAKIQQFHYGLTTENFMVKIH